MVVETIGVAVQRGSYSQRGSNNQRGTNQRGSNSQRGGHKSNAQSRLRFNANERSRGGARRRETNPLDDDGYPCLLYTSPSPRDRG